MGKVETAHRFTKDTLTILALCAFGLALTLPHLDRVWYEHDDGLIGLMAQLTARGMRSHVDFFDPYSGLLNLWHAAFFSILGENMRTPRIAVLLVFLATIPIAFSIACRVLSRRRSIALVSVWVVWGLPQYICSIPSWYCVFLNLVAVAFLASYSTERRKKLLFAAGLITAISISIKVIGLYLLAGSLLFLLYDSQIETRGEPKYAERRGPQLLAVMVALTGVFATLATAFVVRRHLSGEYIFFFVLPSACPWVLVVARELAMHDKASNRLKAILHRRFAPYLAGVLVVALGWVARYPSLSELASVINGIFILPHRRAELITSPLPPISLSVCFAVGALLGWAAWAHRPRLQILFLGSFLGLILAFVIGQLSAFFTRPDWSFMQIAYPGYNFLCFLTPMILIGMFASLSARPRNSDSNSICFLFAAIAAYFQLVMYPFSPPIYFAYCASQLIFISALLFNIPGQIAGMLWWSVLGIWLLVGLATLDKEHYGTFAGPSVLLDTARGQVRFAPAQTEALKQITTIVEGEASGAETIYAGPDAPEILFLTGKQHVGRIIVEALQGDSSNAESLLSRIRADEIPVAVIKHRVPALFAGSLHKAIESRLREIFRLERRLGAYSLLTKSGNSGEVARTNGQSDKLQGNGSP